MRPAQTVEQKIAKRRERWSEAFELVARDEAAPLTAECVALIEAEGLGIPELAKRLGRGSSVIGDYLRDPTGEKARARKRRRYGLCEECGVKTFNSGSYDLPRRCAGCEKKVKREEARARVIKAIRYFNRRYGRPPTAFDWNLSMARSKAHPERLAEIEAIHRDRSWPSVGTAQGVFGSWSAAVEAAGFEPVALGSRRRPRQWKAHLSKRGRMKSSVEVLESEIERNKQRRETLAMREQGLRDEREALSKEVAKLEQAIGVLKQS